MVDRALIGHIGTLTVSQVRHAGRPFEVLPREARFLRAAFAEAGAKRGLTVSAWPWRRGTSGPH